MKRRIVAALVCALVGGTAVGSLSAFATDRNNGGTALRTAADDAYALVSTVKTTAAEQEDGAVPVLDVSEMVENVMPSVVAITNQSVEEVLDIRAWRAVEQESESRGSGIIVGENDDELLICTNNHVVAGAKTLSVSFIDDSTVKAQIKGTDAANDLAIVAVKLDDIDQETRDAIKVAVIGDSDEVKIGEPVVAIGNALGYGQSVTAGIVSAVDRIITTEDGDTYEGLFQTDAAINAGNSGGALLNTKGEVIGINSAKLMATGVEGMGYAIPVSTAKPVLERLMNREQRNGNEDGDAAVIGITAQDVSAEAQELYGIPQGVYIAGVDEGSGAEEAGLKKGDILVGFDDTQVKNVDQLVELLTYYAGGETVEVTISSAESGGYTERTVELTLGSRPAEEEETE